ncbi:MAG: hypothetical protein U0800_24285 [Isosphaeraceae bacterium]
MASSQARASPSSAKMLLTIPRLEATATPNFRGSIISGGATTARQTRPAAASTHASIARNRWNVSGGSNRSAP